MIKNHFPPIIYCNWKLKTFNSSNNKFLAKKLKFEIPKVYAIAGCKDIVLRKIGFDFTMHISCPLYSQVYDYKVKLDCIHPEVFKANDT